MEALRTGAHGPRVGVWGRFDVARLGDLLQPRILERQIRRRVPDATVLVFAPVGSGRHLALDGGLVPAPLERFERDRLDALAGELDAIVIGGGALSGDGLERLLACDYGLTPEEVRARGLARFFAEGLGRRVPLAWNAVEVRELGARAAAALAKVLRGHAYVSVLEGDSAAAMRHAGVAATAVPDPLLLASEAFSADTLDRRLRYLRSQGWFPEEEREGRDGREGRPLLLDASSLSAASAAKEVHSFATRAGLAVVVVETEPEGSDAGQADALAAALRDAYRVPRGANVADLVAAISSAALFVGTPSAGRRVAASFGVTAVSPAREEKSKRVLPLAARLAAAMRKGAEPLDEARARLSDHFDSLAALIPAAGARPVEAGDLWRAAAETRARQMLEQRIRIAERLEEREAERSARIAELEKAVAKVERLTAELTASVRARSELEHQLQGTEAARAGLEKQLLSAADERTSIVAQLEVAAVERARIIEQLEGAGAARAEAEKRAEAAEAARSELERQLLTAGEERRSVVGQLDAAAAERVQIIGLLERANAGHAEAERRLAEVDRARVDAEGRLVTAAEERRALAERLETISAERHELEERLRVADRERGESAKWSEAAAAALVETEGRLRDSQDETKRLEEERRMQEQALTEMREERAQVVAALRDLEERERDQRVEIRAGKREIMRLTRLLEESRAAVERLKANAESWRLAFLRGESEMAEAGRRLAAVEGERDDLVAERDSLRAEVARVAAEREQLRAEEDDLRAQRDALLSEREGLLSEGESLRAEAAGLVAERDALLSEREGLTTERDELSARLVKLRARRDDLAAERDGLAAERDELLLERDRLRSERDALAGERDGLASQGERLRRELSERRDAYAALEAEFRRFTNLRLFRYTAPLRAVYKGLRRAAGLGRRR